MQHTVAGIDAFAHSDQTIAATGRVERSSGTAAGVGDLDLQDAVGVRTDP